MEKEFYINQLKNRSLIIDAHFDLLMDVAIQRGKGRKKVIETDYLLRFKEGGVNIIIAALFVDSSFVPHMALQKALEQVSSLYAEVQESPDTLMICKNSDDMILAQQSGKIGFLLSLEGAEPIGKDLSLLRVFYELGVRNLGLVWFGNKMVQPLVVCNSCKKINMKFGEINNKAYCQECYEKLSNSYNNLDFIAIDFEIANFRMNQKFNKNKMALRHLVWKSKNPSTISFRVKRQSFLAFNRLSFQG